MKTEERVAKWLEQFWTIAWAKSRGEPVEHWEGRIKEPFDADATELLALIGDGEPVAEVVVYRCENPEVRGHLLVVAPEEQIGAVHHFYGEGPTEDHRNWYGPLTPLHLKSQPVEPQELVAWITPGQLLALKEGLVAEVYPGPGDATLKRVKLYLHPPSREPGESRDKILRPPGALSPEAVATMEEVVFGPSLEPVDEGGPELRDQDWYGQEPDHE